MDIKSIKDIALSNILNPDYAYFYRFICRWYSKKFSTPLKDVYNLDLYHLFLTYFEEYYESLAQKENWDILRLEEIHKAINPDYNKEEEEDIQRFVEKIENEAKTKNKKQSLQQDTNKSAMSDLSSSSTGPNANNTKDPLELYKITEEDMKEDLKSFNKNDL